MKVKIEKVIIGAYEYDSIITKINSENMEILFRKTDNVKQYEGKTVELVKVNSFYAIKPIIYTTNKKNSD